MSDSVAADDAPSVSAPLTIAVASGKGGVGKSTVAALLALAYARRGMRVALLDADLYGPSVPTLFHREGERHRVSDDQKIIPVRHGALQLVSFGFILGQLPAVMRGPMIARYTAQLFSDVLWEPHQVLIIDLPPGTGDIHLTVTQSRRIDAAIVVTTPHALSFSDVGKAILMLNKVRVPLVGLVLNMARFDCRQCGTSHYPFGDVSPDVLTLRFGLPVIATLPLDIAAYSRRIAAMGTEGGESGEGGESAEGASVLPDDIVGLAESVWRRARAATSPGVTVANDYRAIRVTDSGGRSYAVSPYDLRRACRCALCYDEYTGAPTASIERVPRDVFARQIKTVGNYALYIKWSDGHDSGFFPLDYIRALARGDAGGSR